jgi:hypothetical protein
MVFLYMFNSTIIFLLGADRVGKSTFAKTLGKSITEKLPQGESMHVRTCHFDGPKPHHNSPIEQYIEKISVPVPELSQSNLPVHLFTVCDRGGAEVCFYEKYRRGLTISEAWAQSFESWVLDKFDHVFVILLKKDFDKKMVYRHMNEIETLAPDDATAYWKKCQLDIRRAEHEAYYKYMGEYFSETTLIPDNFIYTLGDNTKETVDRFVNTELFADDIPF